MGGFVGLSVEPWVIVAVLAASLGVAVVVANQPGPGSPQCCPRPVPQVLPADICPQVLGAACCSPVAV